MKAYILRIAPSRVDRLEEALADDDLIVGWSDVAGLLDPSLSWGAFRQIIHERYYPANQDYTAAGRDAGNLWRFIRDMEEGDLVLIPHGPQFYVARVVGPARYEPQHVATDTAHRRAVQWLNAKKPIPRVVARASLQSRLKIRQTCANATDLLNEIEEVLQLAEQGRRPTFAGDLRDRLSQATLEEIRSGRMNERAYEQLVASVLSSQGGEDVTIVPRQNDKGADVLATFRIASTFKFTLAVQAKHYQPHPPVPAAVLDQLAAGMEAEEADLGWVVTSGSFSDAAITRQRELEDSKGLRIELVDGEQFAAMIVDSGLRAVGLEATDLVRGQSA